MSETHNGPVALSWQEQGAGEPLLLVMGMAFDARMWHRAVSELSKQFRVITFDNRGIGQSRARRQAFTIADLAADAFAVLDAAGVESAHLYGASMGGLTVQEMALSRPERVRSVVLGCTGAPSGHEPPAPLVVRIARWLPRSLLHALFPQALAAMNGPAADPDEGAEDVAIMASTRTPGWVLRAQERAIKGFESSSRVGSITVPTLVLHGDADTVVPLERGEELARLIPGARLVVLPGAGHNYLAGATELANREVSDFLHASTTGAQR